MANGPDLESFSKSQKGAGESIFSIRSDNPNLIHKSDDSIGGKNSNRKVSKSNSKNSGPDLKKSSIGQKVLEDASIQNSDVDLSLKINSGNCKVLDDNRKVSKPFKHPDLKYFEPDSRNFKEIQKSFGGSIFAIRGDVSDLIHNSKNANDSLQSNCVVNQSKFQICENALFEQKASGNSDEQGSVANVNMESNSSLKLDDKVNLNPGLNRRQNKQANGGKNRMKNKNQDNSQMLNLKSPNPKTGKRPSKGVPDKLQVKKRKGDLVDNNLKILENDPLDIAEVILFQPGLNFVSVNDVQKELNVNNEIDDQSKMFKEDILVADFRFSPGSKRAPGSNVNNTENVNMVNMDVNNTDSVNSLKNSGIPVQVNHVQMANSNVSMNINNEGSGSQFGVNNEWSFFKPTDFGGNGMSSVSLNPKP